MLVSACEISRRSKRARQRILGDIDVDIDIGMSDSHQEHRLTHGVGDVLHRHHRLGHTREARELVDHAANVVDLADDRIGALFEDGAVLGDDLAVFAAQPVRPRAESASAGS